MNFIVAIGGGIAAYKTLWLIRLLKKSNHQVKVILTRSAAEFVTPTSVRALSENGVYTDLWSEPNEELDEETEDAGSRSGHNMHHITLAKWADYIIIAPATANRISLLAQGSCQDLLNNVILASQAPLAIVPAMNMQMWNNKATQSNVELLKERGIEIWGPAVGIQACGDNGQGRLLEPEEIMHKVRAWCRPLELGFERLLITLGATQEPLDPVRYITNHSSGRMGLELAKMANQCGVSVTIVHASVNTQLLASVPSSIEKIAVQTAKEMHEAVNSLLERNRAEEEAYDVFIACAAVSDYRPAEYQEQKIKKTKEDELILKLVKNPDILKHVAHNKENDLPFCAGFSLESESLIEHAQEKLKKKNIDIIFANLVNSLNAEQSLITALWYDEQSEVAKKELPYAAKKDNAEELLKLISQRI